MSERDELASIIMAVDEAGNWDPDPMMYASYGDAILAAGYRKPRTITTVEELDALLNKALIRTQHGEYREAAKLVGGENIWRKMGPAKVLSSSDLAAWHLPATVLHEGDAK
jgi:hypothetical protein